VDKIAWHASAYFGWLTLFFTTTTLVCCALPIVLVSLGLGALMASLNERADSGRYDMSWQYRLLPVQHADWGVAPELFSVVELNGRWQQVMGMTRQITLGLQWVKPTWVAEAAMVRNINHHQPDQYMVSTRFHF